MKLSILKVEGMSCSHCVNAIKKSVGALVGVTQVDVDLSGKTVTINYDDKLPLDEIKAVIEDQGYDVL